MATKKPDNVVDGPGAGKAKVPEYITVEILIRKDLITHWGGLVINNFSLNPASGEVKAENVTAPGFTFNVPDVPDRATFEVRTYEGEKGEKDGTRKTGRTGTRKKVTRKKTSRKKSR